MSELPWSRPSFRRTMEMIESVARSRTAGVVLVLAAAVFLSVAWRDADFGVAASAKPLWLVVAACLYGAAIVALAAVASTPLSIRDLVPVLDAQIFKYVPGGLPQSAPLLRAGGARLVGRYALATLVSALAGVLIAAPRNLRIALAMTLTLVAAFGYQRLGARRLLRKGALVAGVALLIAASGSAVALSLDLDPALAGRAVAGGWGIGVLALPVPSGLGVREAAIALLAGPELAAVAVLHRLVTFVTDLSLGVLAVVLRSRFRRSD